MATRVDILTPLGRANEYNPVAISSAINSNVTYNVQGYSSIILQIDAPNDAAAAGTLTLQCSLDNASWYNFPGGAITYTATGVQQSVNVEGLIYVRLQVTTTSGTVEYSVTCTGVANA